MTPHPETSALFSRRNAIRAAISACLVAAAFWLPSPGGVLDVFPEARTIDIASCLGDWLRHVSRTAEIGSVRVSEITRLIGTLASQPYELLKGVFASGFTIYPEAGGKIYIPPLPWVAVVALFVALGQAFGGRKLALGTGATFLFFAMFGIWESAMLTLTLVVVSVLFSTVIGLLLGLWGYKHPALDLLLQPLYDVMQTLPLFSYLVPMILFFGFGPVASLMATVVFSLPPMARVTTQALHDVRGSVCEFGQIAGCRARQLDWLVMIPAARKSLLLGINQVIMLALSVVVVASLIGAGGLGGDVLKALKSLRIGDAIVAGCAVTLMAIMLDRISFALALRRPVHRPETDGWLRRNALLAKIVAAVLAITLLARVVPGLQTFPEAWEIRAGDSANEAVRWLSRSYYDELSALRDAFIIYLLKPVRLFLTGLPWVGVTVVAVVTGYLLKGWRLALLGGAVYAAIAVLGYWEKAMISLYLVIVSVAFSSVLGAALGMVGTLNRPLRAWLIALVDALQTMPMFVYLIPVVMLFSLGEFPAFLAIVAYAITPAIRYTMAALDDVAPSIVESARMSGCSGWQLLTQVRLPLGLPVMLLGINQVIMLAFGMLVITALVGTRGLEETTLVAIAKVEAGDGLLAGLAIAGMAIVFDRYIRAASEIVAYYVGVPLTRKVV
ncbi:MAG: ABC transporter permease subunit [Alphaproteobacteria bacterium]